VGLAPTNYIDHNDSVAVLGIFCALELYIAGTTLPSAMIVHKNAYIQYMNVVGVKVNNYKNN
jgi:hypothetical protein